MSEKSRCIIIFFIIICLYSYTINAAAQEPLSEQPPAAFSADAGDNNSSTNNITEKITASPPQEITTAPFDTSSLKRVETEIAAFTLQGERRRHKLEIFDLDVLITPEGRRFIPLFRLLDALKLEKTEKEHSIIFQPEAFPEVTIDTQKKEIRINETTAALDFIMAISDISMQRDLFLSPEVISRIFSMELEWDDEAYAFMARTKKMLSIWKRPKRKSLLAIETEELVDKLPEAHGPALPERRKLSLDFVELQARAKFKAVDPNSSKEVKITSLEQTLWGALANGRYKIKLTEPDQTYYKSEFESADDPPVMISWGEWRYTAKNIEAVAGDSNFGLNDLIFPTVGMAGLRINGVSGFNETDHATDTFEPGLSRKFESPLKFEGYAPVGSPVELIVNDRVTDTDEVITSLPSRPGIGMYSFEEVSLAPGSINDIRIEITEPNGVLTVIEKSIFGTSNLLEKGRFAYLTGVGTNRETDEWEAYGTFAGARGFYGISDRLTIGITTAFQERFNDPVESLSDSEDRQYPDSSLHAGAQFGWKPFDNSIFLGDFAWVKGTEGDAENGFEDEIRGQYKDKDRFEDFSFQLNGRFFPGNKIELQGLCFWYGPDFFNGSNRDLRDRQGYVLNTKWSLFSNWSLYAAGGQVWDNVKDDKDETLNIEFQSAKISTGIIPRSKLSVSFDRLVPSWDEDEKNNFFFELRSNPFFGINFTGTYSAGDDLDLDDNDDFFDGLRLPGISLHKSRNTTARIKKNLPWGGSLGLSYRESENNEEASVIHSWKFRKWLPIEIRTELGHDIYEDTIFFENRTEIPLGRSRKTRAGIHSEYDKREWKVEIYFNITEIFSLIGGRPRYISGSRMNPDNGAICGKVFLDRNANAVLDPGEPGVSDLEVLLNNRRSAETDENGNFLYKLPGDAEQVQLNLHPDSIPAIYSCTHGRQKANLKQGEITRVNFGVTPVNVISGYVLSKGAEDEQKSVGGVRVYVLRMGTDEQIAESITANDGSYYLEDIRPGDYTVQIDPETVPFEYVVQTAKGIIVGIAAGDEPKEIQLQDFVIIIAPDNSDLP